MSDQNAPVAECERVWCYVDPSNCDIPDLEAAYGSGHTATESTKFSVYDSGTLQTTVQLTVSLSNQNI